MKKPSVICKEIDENYIFAGFLTRGWPLFVDPGQYRKWWNSLYVFSSIKEAKNFMELFLPNCKVKKIEDIK